MSAQRQPLLRWTTPASFGDALGPRPVVLITSSFPTPSNPLSGPFVHTMVELLRAEGHHVQVLTPSDGLVRGETQGAHFVRFWLDQWSAFHRSGLPELIEARDPRVLTTPSALLSLAAAARVAIARLGPRALMVAHWLVPCGALSRLVAAGLPGVDRVVVCHSGGARLLGAMGPIGAAVARFALEGAEVIATCDDVRDTLQAMVGPLGPRKCSVRPMPIPPPARVAWPRREGPRRLLFMGRLVPIKGLEALLDDVAGLSGVELHVAGDGPLREPLRRVAPAHVVFHGVVTGEAKARLFSESHGFVLPSTTLESGRTEGVPVSLLEAMSYQLPIFVRAVGGVEQAVEGYPHGCVIDGELEAFLEVVEDRWR